MKTPISEVEVVGYEAPFVEREERGARRLTPWFRWKISTASETEYLLPPFRITMTDVVDGYFAGGDTIDLLADRKEGTRLPEPRKGEPGYTLWMNGEGIVKYDPRNDVTVALRNYALGEIVEAWRKIESKEYGKALGCVGRALSADGSIPGALIAKGVVERRMENERGYNLTLEVATKQVFD